MTVAQAHEINMWIAFIVVALPCLIVFGGRFLTSMARPAALALFFSHPLLAIALAAIYWFPWRILFYGLVLGEGLKISGVVGRLSRRSRRYPRRSGLSTDGSLRRAGWPRAEVDRADLEDRRGPEPTIRGFSREQIRELQRRFPDQLGD